MTADQLNDRQIKTLLKKTFHDLLEEDPSLMATKDADKRQVGVRFNPPAIFQELIDWNAAMLVKQHRASLLEQSWVPDQLRSVSSSRKESL